MCDKVRVLEKEKENEKEGARDEERKIKAKRTHYVECGGRVLEK